jgi:hypothetical protein
MRTGRPDAELVVKFIARTCRRGRMYDGSLQAMVAARGQQRLRAS